MRSGDTGVCAPSSRVRVTASSPRSLGRATRWPARSTSSSRRRPTTGRVDWAGCGKTRLALQAAADATEGFVDGAWFVDLAPLGDPGMLPRAVADAFGVKEEGARDVTATVLEHLQSRRALVLLDNCEHVI